MTGCTGQSGAPVYLQGLFEIARLAIAVGKIPQGGATKLDRLLQNILYTADQVFIALPGNLAGRYPGIDTCQKQGFIGVNIADTHNDVTVHDEGLDRGLAEPAFLK